MGKSSKPAANPYAEASAGIAKKTFKQTEPLRQNFLTDWLQMMQGGTPQFAGTMFSGMRPAVDAQYDVSKQNILANTPAGGGLTDALSSLESARGSQMSSLINQIWMDQINKAYGSAWNAPQQSMAGLGQAGNAWANAYGAEAGRQGGMDQQLIQSGAQAAMAGAGACCFNFLEADGEIYHTVRRYRDEHCRKDGNVSKGYVKSASVFVPLMRRFTWFKTAIRFLMTRPLKAYASWVYGENRYGFIFWPFAKGWVNMWRLIGWGVN